MVTIVTCCHGAHCIVTMATLMYQYNNIGLMLFVPLQVLAQFPVAFEFNDFYLRMMAYHSCSMRFHTFALNSDKERSEQGWQDYQMAWTHSKNTRAEGFSSFWTFVEGISKESMMFHNFNYSPDLSKVCCPSIVV